MARWIWPWAWALAGIEYAIHNRLYIGTRVNDTGLLLLVMNNWYGATRTMKRWIAVNEECMSPCHALHGIRARVFAFTGGNDREHCRR